MVVRRCKVHGPKTGLNHLLLNAMQNYFYFFVFTLQKGKYFYILLNKSKNNAESAGLLCFRPHLRPLSDLTPGPSPEERGALRCGIYLEYSF